jgi:hypothetical protein
MGIPRMVNSRRVASKVSGNRLRNLIKRGKVIKRRMYLSGSKGWISTKKI